jgi:N-methylhydantoinase A
MLDIHTAGAGGGSLARFDAGGMLRVGPESAGADPGPICFGRGNLPTVTDANFLLGRLDPASFLGGGVNLDRPRAERIMREHKGPIATVEEFAAGILRVVESHMERAIRVVSIERGNDPRDSALVAFGGGGPLHACALARSLRIPTVLVPAMPGALSAVGILLADAVRDHSRTVMLPGDAIATIDQAFAELEQSATAEFLAEGLHGEAYKSLDLRYRGQGYEINVPFNPYSPVQSIDAFHELHRQRYGIADPQRAVEIVNLRLRMIAAGEPWSPPIRECVLGDGGAAIYAEQEIYFDSGFVKAALFRRGSLVPGDTIEGPAMITEYTSATILPPGAVTKVDGYGNLVITFTGEATA